MMALTMHAGTKRAARRKPRSRRKHKPPLDPQQQALKKARSRVNHRIAFFGHSVVYGSTCMLLLVVAGPLVMFIVALAWGIGLAAHGFFAVAAPLLRDQWIEAEVNREVNRQVGSTIADERRHLGGEHARQMHQLSASVAHEIRNPITAAKSLVQQMGEDPTSEQNIEYARVAIAELDRVERSISHLLRYAREEDLNMAEVRLNPIISAALDTLRERLDAVEIAQDLIADDHLYGDADALRRAMINLLANALDAMEEANTPAPRIELSSGHDLSGTQLWLRVQDNGPGIEPERAADIFNPFHTTKTKGTGLGLAITKKSIEAHGGSIELDQAGSGCTFIITLPIQSTAGAGASQQGAAQPTAHQQAAHQQGPSSE